MAAKVNPEETIGDYAREYYKQHLEIYKKACLKFANDMRNGVKADNKYGCINADPKGNWIQDDFYSGCIGIDWMYGWNGDDPSDEEIKKNFDKWFLETVDEETEGEISTLAHLIAIYNLLGDGYHEDLKNYRDYTFMILMQETEKA